jgi:hypothetical protein
VEQRDGAARLALGAFPLPHVAADDHGAGRLSLVNDRRDRQRQIEFGPIFRAECVLRAANGAAA